MAGRTLPRSMVPRPYRAMLDRFYARPPSISRTYTCKGCRLAIAEHDLVAGHWTVEQALAHDCASPDRRTT